MSMAVACVSVLSCRICCSCRSHGLKVFWVTWSVRLSIVLVHGKILCLLAKSDVSPFLQFALFGFGFSRFHMLMYVHLVRVSGGICVGSCCFFFRDCFVVT